MSLKKNNSGASWLKTPDAVTALGVSRDTLRRRRLEGFFVEGTHYLRTSPGRSGWYLWNVDRDDILFFIAENIYENGRITL